jgi:hypothetical protein
MKAVGALNFARVTFNEAVDPGPPTEDAYGTKEALYRASLIDSENGEYHLTLEPVSDPRRDRLRELWVDAKTFETKQVIVDDRLFIQPGPIVPVYMQMEFVNYKGMAVIFRIQAVTRWMRDAREVQEQTDEFLFTNISFPDSLPSWYFEPKTYREHMAEAPMN